MRKLLIVVFAFLVLVSCGKQKEYPLGSEKNPVKMFFVPSAEVGKIVSQAEELEKYLEDKTGYHFKIEVPMSYAAVIEAIGVNNADIAWLGTFAYVLANEKYGAEVALTTLRKGMAAYRGQFVAKASSNIFSVEDLQGKTIAYTDKGSTSGYIYPAGMLNQKNIEPKNVLFAGGHPQAISAVYDGRADAGCSFWSPEYEGVPQDARKLVAENLPDVYDKVKIIGLTDWIPNDTVVFRKNMDNEMKNNILRNLLAYSETEEGKEVLRKLYEIDGFTEAKDDDYDVVRKTVEALGYNLEEMVK
jgi:phosphonate transport system substrate-binding protein